MSENLNKKVLEVAGMPTNKKVIKFKGDDTWYDISDKVQKYDLVKYGIIAGAVVDVTFDDKQIVIYLKVKEGGKAETPSEVEAPIKSEEKSLETLVIAGVAKNKKVLKFTGQDGWSAISDELQKLDYDAVGYKSGNTVLVEKDDKGVIVSMVEEVTREPVTEVSQSPKTTSYGNYSVENSIEAQVAWKGAVKVVVAMITIGVLLPQDVDEELKKLTSIGITSIASR